MTIHRYLQDPEFFAQFSRLDSKKMSWEEYSRLANELVRPRIERWQTHIKNVRNSKRKW